MADESSYPWQCIRDGAVTSEVASSPLLGNVANRMHKEWHDSESGKCVEAPKHGIPVDTAKK